MYAYKSNPVLPDSDFDGRDDTRDRARALLNDYTFEMDTLNNNGIHFDFTMDYRYFFMDSSYYYYELSDMSLALSNMIGDNKHGGMKSYFNRNPLESNGYGTGINSYMWYTGFEDIEERNTGEVPYAIGHRDVFLRRGKVNHKLRNLITIVIGEDERYKNAITANLESDGYHHTGFDIEADKIVEEIDEYINRQSGSKVYWITGFGSGGSIANLVGQKLTDKKGVENVYCYTFESYPTINANNLQSNNNTRFSRYTNIFNILNDDNPLTKILDGSVGWYRYGRNVTGSAASVFDKKGVKSILGSNYIGHNGYAEYKGNPSIARRILDGIINVIKDLVRNFVDGLSHLVSGFTNTEPYEQTYRAPFESQNINTDIHDNRQGREEMHKRFNLYGIESEIKDWTQVSAGKDGGSIEGEFGNKNVVVGNMNLPHMISQEYLPGSFIDSYNLMEYSTHKDRLNYNYQYEVMDNNYECIRLVKSNNNESLVKDMFKYSNYTISQDEHIKSYDISYSQFWNKDENKLREILSKYNKNENDTHYSLYKNNAGDFGKKTTNMIFGRYHKGMDSANAYTAEIVRDRISKVDGEGGECIDLYDGYSYDCDIALVDGRILTAAPLHLLLSTDTTVNKGLYGRKMHIKENYGTDGTGTYLQHDSEANNIASKNKQFTYMDLVMESTSGYQYVVPFMVVDVKDLHNNESSHYSSVTDNTYGHVFESISQNGDGENVTTYSHMNPIEPYLKLRYRKADGTYDYCNVPLVGNASGEINNALKTFLFSNPKDRVVSMRLYDKHYDENDSSWWRDKRDSLGIKTEIDYIRDVAKADCIHKGNIVKFNINGDE